MELCCDALRPVICSAAASDHGLCQTVQYADDCIAFLNNKNELCTVLNLISEYGKASGLTLNLSKCEDIWLGVDKTRQKDCKLF